MKKEYYSNGRKKYLTEIHYLNDNGKLNNENGPARITFYKSGKVEMEEYYINGKQHNENGPALIKYYENGNIRLYQYFLNNEVQPLNEKNLVCIEYYENGKVRNELYYNKETNETKNIMYDENGKIIK